MRKLLLGGVLALMAVSASAEYDTSVSDKQIIDDAKGMVSASLKDPDSATFKNVKVYRVKNKNTGNVNVSAVCGEVNAKNSYGGYVGYSNFAVMLLGKKPTIAVENSERSLYPMLKAFCQD